MTTEGSDVSAEAGQPAGDRWMRWLTLAANIGVLLSLLVLIVEVRQNASLTHAAMEQGKNDFLAQIELGLASREMSEVWVKSIRTPEALTDAEARMVEGYLVAVMLQWEHRFQMERAGLSTRAESRQHLVNSAPYYFGSRFAKNWWRLQAPGWEGSPLLEVANPIVEAVDDDFLVNYLDKVRMPAPAGQGGVGRDDAPAQRQDIDGEKEQ